MRATIILLLFIKSLSAEEEGILCDAETCADYIDANPCPELPDNCKIQNSTHNGIFLPSADPCNCCEYCLENLHEGDYCAQGEAGGAIPDSICGPGLTCSASGTCVQMSAVADSDAKATSCSKAQNEYDTRRKDGTLGFMQLRPDCDEDGLYLSYKCVPGQTCFCVDKDGKRIFGEIPYSSTANLIPKCVCPRKYYDVLKFFDDDFLHPNQYFRCTETGDYDTIQCIDDSCFCTDAHDGVPTFPERTSVNISSISKNTLADCFDKNRHLEGKFYYECAQKYLNLLEEVESYKKDGYDTVFEIDFPNCDLDGKYAPRQKGVKTNQDNTKETYYYCVGPNGARLENYESSDENTDCKCARSSLLITANAAEKPQCCQNGNFNPIQCRNGKCYCVDSDGYQDVDNQNSEAPNNLIEANINEKEKLFCYKSDIC